MFPPTDPDNSPGSMMTYVLRLFMIVFVQSATTTPPDKHRRDTEGGALSSGDIINIVGVFIGLFVGLPGLIVVFIQARKYWRRRRARKSVSTIIINGPTATD